MPDLEWDRTWFENTGKWRLFNPSLEVPHECKKEPEPTPEKIKRCPHPMCDKSMNATKLQDHVKKEHIDWGDYT